VLAVVKTAVDGQERKVKGKTGGANIIVIQKS